MVDRNWALGDFHGTAEWGDRSMGHFTDIISGVWQASVHFEDAEVSANPSTLSPVISWYAGFLTHRKSSQDKSITKTPRSLLDISV